MAPSANRVSSDEGGMLKYTSTNIHKKVDKNLEPGTSSHFLLLFWSKIPLPDNYSHFPRRVSHFIQISWTKCVVCTGKSQRSRYFWETHKCELEYQVNQIGVPLGNTRILLAEHNSIIFLPNQHNTALN